MYEMKEEYYIGVELIDEEHKKLFEIADSAYQLMKNEFVHDKYDGFREILDELIEYTKKHFSDEEAYMESIQYKRIFSQKVQHQEFIDRLEGINLDDVDEDPEAALEGILTFLTDWLVNHIMIMDKRIGVD